MNEELDLLLEQLNDQQKKIVKSPDNLVVTACPGSGKTRVLTYKLAYNAILYPNSYKKIVAITYTNRAADEIKDRLDLLDIDESPIWAGTIHQFCLENIIYPYAMMLPRLCKGFKIIDEYMRDQYIQQILDEMDIDLPYYEKAKIITRLDNDMKIIERKYTLVVKEYHDRLIQNKEIDFDLILNLSYALLNSYGIIAINISSIIRSIYIDEYQDTNELQYQIIGLLSKANSTIKLLFVGDTDQAIYGGLGGVAKNLDEISEITALEFRLETLNGCYRSTQRIIDYYSCFQDKPYKIISCSQKADVNGVIALDTSIHKNNLLDRIAEIIRIKLDEGIVPKEICVIAPQWFLLYPLSKNLRDILPDVPFDAPDISPIKADDLNIFYQLARLIFTEAGKNVPRRKRIASEIINILSEEYNISLPNQVDCFWILQKINGIKPYTTNGVEHFRHVVIELFNACGIDEVNYPDLYTLYDSFTDKINTRIASFNLSSKLDTFYKCFKEREGVVITSCHKIKGEEYNTVIAFGILYGMIPHWDTIYNPNLSETSDAKKLLYVMASRAKESLYLFAEQGRTTKKGVPYSLTEILRTYPYEYDI